MPTFIHFARRYRRAASQQVQFSNPIYIWECQILYPVFIFLRLGQIAMLSVLSKAAAILYYTRLLVRPPGLGREGVCIPAALNHGPKIMVRIISPIDVHRWWEQTYVCFERNFKPCSGAKYWKRYYTLIHRYQPPLFLFFLFLYSH